MCARSAAWVATALLTFAAVPVANGRDFFLVVGGGPEPWSDQISIEHNVLFFGQTQECCGVSPDTTHTLYASGVGEEVDVCFNHGLPSSPVHELLSSARGENRNLGLDYRHHRIAAAEGPATRDKTLGLLKELAGELKDSDRLLIYFTGHGAKGSHAETSSFQSWGKHKLDVATFAKALDAFAPEVEVMVVMVQCYSGAFANLIFEGGNPEKELSAHRRAGYFSTVGTRPAAGCTPDINRADYQDYSTYFWGAIGGKDRLGEVVTPIDVDGDGQISFAEAHIYALTQSPAIDIPIKSSDCFLRRYAVREVEREDGVTWDSEYSRLLGVATPAERTVLETLSTKLELQGEGRVAAAHRHSEEIAKQRESRQRQLRRSEKGLRELATTLDARLVGKWPVLRSPWHLLAQGLMSDRRDELETFLKSEPKYTEWLQLKAKVSESKEEDLAEEKKWAQLRRIVHVAETVALAENLRNQGDSRLREAYDRLTKLEAWKFSFGAQSATEDP